MVVHSGAHPFDLVTVDSRVVTGGDDGAAAASRGAWGPAPPVWCASWIYAREYLSDPGIVRDRAAFLLARLYPADMPVALATFLIDTSALARAGGGGGGGDGGGESASTSAASEQEATFLVPGVARALAAIFKLGTRSALVGVAERAWVDARDLAASPAAVGSALVRQLASKLTQRIDFSFLSHVSSPGATSVVHVPSR